MRTADCTMPPATRRSLGPASADTSREQPPLAGRVDPAKIRAPATSSAPGRTARQVKDTSAGVEASEEEEDEPWTSIRRIFVSRTLQLHTLSPLHVPRLGRMGASSKGAASGSLSLQLFEELGAELRSYINIRLSDGMSVLHVATGRSTEAGGGGQTGQREDTMLEDASGRNLPIAKRRRIGDTVGSAQISAVRMGWLPDLDLVNPHGPRGWKRGQMQQQMDESSQAWAIEIELHRPPEPATKGKKRKSKAAVARAKAWKAIRLGDLCHLVFLPSSSGAERATMTSTALAYPVLVTRSCTNAAPDVNRAVLTHALNWVQARFDCRVSTAAGSAARRLKGLAVSTDVGAEVSAGIEALAEKIVVQARGEKEEIDRLMSRGRHGLRGLQRDDRIDDSAYAAGPVELAFTFPSELWDDLRMDGSKVPGPAPDLKALTLTVPWPVCMRLLDETPPETPLLPAIKAYLSQHTSLDLTPLTLSRIGAAGINFGLTSSACRVKFYDLEVGLVASGTLAKMQRERVTLVLQHLRGMIEHSEDR
ncbi:hypothetical protein K437DRAFT_147301 [Tilletiaria anomala UBC 951]|uniref:Uncharacterized protein n=1 Tax=Tilletiaria anomala (strain ATCC 24038 / CBS 436.72 / UBC 951) TaxID=1037660 RepID=A0A066VXX4_TILAU|nr:uncharacterized protein K437DRAFT_147301 [Tilletiaria anomala UBC 951]KDN43674.1 hypothetical protein K437DRAFT_147301 [Tilletiaria anomala UBC 951]